MVSEGQNPAGSTIGTNGCGYVLTSFGVQPTNQIGNLTPVGPDISMSDTLLGGEVKHYQFTVSPGVLAMEVRLDNRVANPRMTLRADGLPVHEFHRLRPRRRSQLHLAGRQPDQHRDAQAGNLHDGGSGGDIHRRLFQRGLHDGGSCR